MDLRSIAGVCEEGHSSLPVADFSGERRLPGSARVSRAGGNRPGFADF